MLIIFKGGQARQGGDRGGRGFDNNGGGFRGGRGGGQRGKIHINTIYKHYLKESIIFFYFRR